MALKITYLDALNNSDLNVYRAQPFKKGDLLHAKIKDFKILSQGSDVKTVYSLKLELKEKIDYLPGDTIAILPRNDENEVKKLLLRLKCENYCEKICKLEREDGKPLPVYLPPVSTLLEIFLNHVNIRTPPKKTFISALIPFASDAKEQAELSFIASPKGKEKYSDLIAGKGSTLLGFLNEFPSILPPIEKILSNLTALLPRYYSICSLSNENDLEIVFFLMTLTNGLKGVSTGWLENLINRKSEQDIQIYLRESSKFQFSQLNNNIPTVLVATGTGISPFIGFLRYRDFLIKNNPESKFDDIFLYFGCRYEKDFLFKQEIMQFLKEGVFSHFYSAFSRETAEKNYVQHKIWETRVRIYDLLLKNQGKVYICGSKEMVKDVKETLVNIVKEIDDCEKNIAEDVVKELESNGNILIDLWT